MRDVRRRKKERDEAVTNASGRSDGCSKNGANVAASDNIIHTAGE